jgi:hypothetical protein
VPKGLVRIKEKSLNLKFKFIIFNIRTKLARISFKHLKYIVSYCSITVAAIVILGVSQ